MNEYLSIFIDQEYPNFIDKYLQTKTLERLKYVSQFCGCDYTKLYSPLFFYSRFYHSLVVAHMTWHFTHDKKATIAALLHDIGTPCFAHTIDYVLGDYENQESSEKDIISLMKKDYELVTYLKEDHIDFSDLSHLSFYPILENKSPKLCTDRLDGVLGTCAIWLHTHSFKEIKEVYHNLTILENEEGVQELGFKDKKIGEKFVKMTMTYAYELQGNKDKYVMQYIADIIKKAISKNFFSLDNLYTKKESEIISILNHYFSSWKVFQKTKEIKCTNELPKNYYISLETKKRNVIPLIKTLDGNKRISDISLYAKECYQKLNDFHDFKYAYVEKIEKV